MNTYPTALISAKEFAVLRHGLRHVTHSVEAGHLDLAAIGLDDTDLMTLDIKLDNILKRARAVGDK